MSLNKQDKPVDLVSYTALKELLSTISTCRCRDADEEHAHDSNEVARALAETRQRLEDLFEQKFPHGMYLPQNNGDLKFTNPHQYTNEIVAALISTWEKEMKIRILRGKIK